MPTSERNIEFSPNLEQLTLEEVVDRIKKRAPNPTNISLGSQNFDEAFLHAGVDQGMTPEEWDRWWSRWEAELKDLGRKKGSTG
jgi:hypothetical protein